MIIIYLYLRDTDTPNKDVIVNDFFDIQKGYPQKNLFALYQRARAKLGVTKYGKSHKGEG